MVPRLSAPAITSARRTPGMGRSTMWSPPTPTGRNPADIELVPAYQRIDQRTLPMVPISTTSIPAACVPFINCASCPVTLPISWLRSPAARTTPGQSSLLTTRGTGLPFAASTKAAGDGDVLTYFGPPRALPHFGHREIAKRTRKAARTVLPRAMLMFQVRPRTHAGFMDNKKANRSVLIVPPRKPDYSLRADPQ